MSAKLTPNVRTADLDIFAVSNLARIQLTPNEAIEFAKQFSGILGLFHHLSQVDVTGVEPTAHAFNVENVWGEDVLRSGLSVEDALKNAPAQRENMVVVPKVVE